MPTVLRVGPYRFYFYAGDRYEPPLFMLSVRTKLQNSGLIRRGYKAAVDFPGQRLVESRDSFANIVKS